MKLKKNIYVLLIDYSKIFYLLLLTFYISCDKTFDQNGIQNENIDLNYNFLFPYKNDSVSVNIGIWMFNEKRANKDHIANWLNLKHNNKSIIEPINILWIDFKAENRIEANENIVNFLKANGLLTRKYSSTGYYGLFEKINWIDQYPETWSNNQNPRTVNNHGRVFLSHKIERDSVKPFFVSTGAFSIEDELHHFVSFEKALHQFINLNEWSLYKKRLLEIYE